MAVKARIAECFADLFVPSRYKAFYGGRGSGKSHNFATALILKGAESELRVGCFREVQKSIRDSVKRLLDDKIKALQLERFYQSTDFEIRAPNGSLFLFAGLKGNADTIRSMEGLDIAWIEEANTVSQGSLDTLVPTIRKPKSEIWASWNPRYPNDPVDAMFRGKVKPPSSIVREVNYDQNPWFPPELEMERQWDLRRDPERHNHIWLGSYRRHSEARVFRNWRVETFEAPMGTMFKFGADWGFATDPTVLIRCYVSGRTLFIDYEAYGIGVEIDRTPTLFDSLVPEEWGMARQWPIRADSARPETISYMKRNGYPRMTPALKGRNSVEDGIEFMRSFDIVVHPRCRHVIDELTMFSYKTDPMTDEVLPIVEDKRNHTIDAIRYAVELLRRGNVAQIGYYRMA